MAPQSTHPIKRACYSFIDLGKMKGWDDSSWEGPMWLSSLSSSSSSSSSTAFKTIASQCTV